MSNSRTYRLSSKESRSCGYQVRDVCVADSSPLPCQWKTKQLPTYPPALIVCDRDRQSNWETSNTTTLMNSSVTRYVSVYDLTMCVNTCLLYLVQPMEPATQWSKVKDALVFFYIKIFRWSLTKCSLRFKMKSCF